MTLRHLCLTSAIALTTALPAMAEPVFNRISSFATPLNMSEGQDRTRPSSAEIITVSEDGNTLIYSDSPLGVLGFVDITDPRAPKAIGNVELGGEPTTTVVIGGRAFAGVNTSESFVSPSGKLVMIDIATRKIEGECDIGGQPDSVARAKDGSFIAIAVENERDEEVNDGALPQMPAGYVVKLPLNDGVVDCSQLQKIEVTGLAANGAEDPEPEYLDINDAGEIVVTLQENNHVVIIGADGKVASHFSAGSVDLTDIDTKKDGRLDFTGKMDGVAREPDAVKWIDGEHVVMANEGDWEGGSRSFSIFKKDGTLVYESGPSLEHAIAAIGHYPEHRNKKGVELESVEVASFGDKRMLFMASERASIIGVYDLTDIANPVLTQLLPSGVSLEGMVSIPARNLFATANEADLREDGLAPAHVMLFELAEGEIAYPMITSAGTESLLGWGALSGLVAGDAPGQLFAVSDSVYSNQPRIFTIDATQKPARITGAIDITRAGQPAQKLDIEAITRDGEGGFWLANEGRTDHLIPHAIFNVDAAGEIQKEIALPDALTAHQTRFGIEGIALVDDTLWMAIQRPWGDDPEGHVKLLSYNLADEKWGAVHYPLNAAPEGGWVGISEMASHDGWLYLIERDNQIADKAATKLLTRVKLEDLKPAEIGGALPVAVKETVRDLIPDLKVLNGYVVDKVEGFAVDAAGNAYAITDNDGIDDSSGETLFWQVQLSQ